LYPGDSGFWFTNPHTYLSNDPKSRLTCLPNPLHTSLDFLYLYVNSKFKQDIVEYNKLYVECS
jgi:hypothetical protein